MFKVEYAPGMTAEKIEQIKQERAQRDMLNGLSEDDRAVYIAKQTIDAARLAGDVVISATISEITHRKDGGWLRANIDSNGFTAISGIPYKCVKVEKGMKIEVTGSVEYWRERKQLKFTPSGLLISERSYCADPFMRAVQRACKSFSVTRLQTLKTVLGDDWIKVILTDPFIKKKDRAEERLIAEYGKRWRHLATAAQIAIFHKYPEALDIDAFERWPIESKQGTVAVAQALNDLTTVKLDMLKINYPVIHNGIIDKIDAREPIDAMVFVRQRMFSFAQADDLNRLDGDTFKASIPRVIGTVWDALASGEDDGNSALSVVEIIERARLQYGYPIKDISAAIDEAKGIVEIKSQGKFDHSLVTIGADKSRSLAFSENAKIERGILINVKGAANTFAIKYEDGKGLDDTQNDAVRMALNSGISIITGGPGTGKTIICGKIAKSLTSVLGLAVAARAARNLTDKT